MTGIGLKICINGWENALWGAAALAGTTFPIDRNFTARELGFDKPTENSIDSVSDRDHMVEFTAAAAMCFMHLTRLSEELIFIL